MYDYVLYLMIFSAEQIKRASKTLKLSDVSKIHKHTPFTSEQTLYETSLRHRRFVAIVKYQINENSHLPEQN